jgi:hypothetical protein
MKTNWETCSRPDCVGAATSPGGSCFGHLNPDGELQDALRGLASGASLDARGVAFDTELLSVVLDSVPHTSEGRPLLRNADFTKARFEKSVRFQRVVFEGETHFDGAIFAGHASFAGATFDERSSFRRAVFGAGTRFERCVFGDQASFANAEFGDGTRFDAARFGDHASLVDTTWGSDASFAGATFGWRMHADRAVFGDRASFRVVVFDSEASLRKTTFGIKASFEGASFARGASFSASIFGNDANFAETTFAPGISFRRVTFGRQATFRRTTFGDRAWFTHVTFGPGASFAQATFEGRARFNLTTFAERAGFEETTFSGQVTFESAVFGGRTTFRLATFERARSFGPLVVIEPLSLEQTSFLEPVRLEIAAPRVLASRARFPEGADLRMRWAEIVLDEADFGAPSILASAPPFPAVDEQELVKRLSHAEERPRLLSVRGANVSELVLAGLDLSVCRFVGAHNLDRLRIEGDSFFAHSPAATSRRRVIGEEQEWRAHRRRRWPKWTAPDFAFPTEGVEKPGRLNPDEIASIYRVLRRGRESNGDAPGAADFYFGEMEMRRVDEKSPRAERAILWLYWLVSGYALRSLRALAALLVTVVVFAVLFRWWGFTPRVGLTRAFLFSAESTSSLFRVPETEGTSLTEVGEVLHIALRLLGPLFFGLALLSLRGRVRR